jgi:hypothetical protein
LTSVSDGGDCSASLFCRFNPLGKYTEFYFHLVNYKLMKDYEGFEVLTAAVMKSPIFWDIN